MDIRLTDSSRRMNCLDEPIVDRTLVDEPKVDELKNPHGT